MKKLIVLSLLVNIAILVPACIGLAIHSDRLEMALGEATPARGILLSIYLSILAVSVFLLKERAPRPIAALLLVQILYKLSTPFTVGTFDNPVVISNLVVAALHTFTFLSIYRTMGNPFRREEPRMDTNGHESC